MNKIIFIDKDPGWTSFDVVAKLRSNLNSKYQTPNTKKIKVGHAGTLDPFATGLLIVLAGDAAKDQDRFMKQDKEYEATLKLGYTSTTGDPEGEVHQLPITNYQLPIETARIKEVLQKFTGAIGQTPPQFSAIKIQGKPAYKYARAGKSVELKSRQVTIYELKVIDYSWPSLKIKVKCSSGTYIRTLAEDIGKSLGTGAYLTELRRTKIGKYKVAEAQKISEYIDSLKS